MPAISINNVDVFRGSSHILKEISLHASEGELVILIGPNGSGKTTLLRTVAGHLPYDGSITLQGKELQAWKPAMLAKNLSFVRQALPISFDFSSLEMVLLGRSPHKSILESYSKDDFTLVKSIMHDLDLSGMEDRSILELSGGERQRVLLAQALAQETSVILLDEPTTHLDIHHKYDFLARVKEYAENGKTVVAAVHDLQLAAQYADRIVVLDSGKIVTAGPAAEVLTSDLISNVFRVNADVSIGANNSPLIQYNYAE